MLFPEHFPDSVIPQSYPSYILLLMFLKVLQRAELGTGSLLPHSCQGRAAGNILGSSVTLTTRKLSITSHLLYPELDTY